MVDGSYRGNLTVMTHSQSLLTVAILSFSTFIEVTVKLRLSCKAWRGIEKRQMFVPPDSFRGLQIENFSIFFPGDICYLLDGCIVDQTPSEGPTSISTQSPSPCILSHCGDKWCFCTAKYSNLLACLIITVSTTPPPQVAIVEIDSCRCIFENTFHNVLESITAIQSQHLFTP